MNEAAGQPLRGMIVRGVQHRILQSGTSLIGEGKASFAHRPNSTPRVVRSISEVLEQRSASRSRIAADALDCLLK